MPERLEHSGEALSEADTLMWTANRERRPDLAALAVAKGTDSARFLIVATMSGHPEIVQALIDVGVSVPNNALWALGDIEVTDYRIDSDERERDYAETAAILLKHGASIDVPAYNDQPLITTFPKEEFPIMHMVLSSYGSEGESHATGIA